MCKGLSTVPQPWTATKPAQSTAITFSKRALPNLFHLPLYSCSKDSIPLSPVGSVSFLLRFRPALVFNVVGPERGVFSGNNCKSEKWENHKNLKCKGAKVLTLQKDFPSHYFSHHLICILLKFYKWTLRLWRNTVFWNPLWIYLTLQISPTSYFVFGTGTLDVHQIELWASSWILWYLCQRKYLLRACHK